MKRLINLFVFVFLLSACTKDISNYNEETKRAAQIPAGTLFTSATKVIADGLAHSSVNINVFRFTVSHWAMAVYQDEAQYDFTTRAIPQAWWVRFYRDVLADLKESAKIIEADGTLTTGEKANKLAMIDIMQVYSYNILVTTFGDVPYSEALNGANLFPKYDDAAKMYSDLLKRLTDDISKLSATSPGFAATEDLLYKGNITKWQRFANSLRMKMGMLVADSDNANAKANVEASDASAISSAADNATFVYLTASPNQNPVFVDIVTGGRSDYIAAEDLMNTLTNLNDPRKAQYFGTSDGGLYKGGVVGKVNTFSDFSKPSPKVAAADAASILLDYIETEFLRAEAKERGYNVVGTAEQHYNNAIKASIKYWGGTDAEADAYLSQPAVAYSTAAGDWRQKIGIQKWIALYNRPFDGWTELRRLDYPKITVPVSAKSGFPNRLTYPGNEQQLNGTNYTNASKAIGGDKVETKLWWDKF
jgi:hypothetical protein